jgi:hypothetical protein
VTQQAMIVAMQPVEKRKTKHKARYEKSKHNHKQQTLNNKLVIWKQQ